MDPMHVHDPMEPVTGVESYAIGSGACGSPQRLSRCDPRLPV